MIITVMIGPTEARAVKPKASSPERPLVFFDAAKPAPKARINGTVTGPVVTPPESKAIGRKSPFPSSLMSPAKAKTRA